MPKHSRILNFDKSALCVHAELVGIGVMLAATEDDDRDHISVSTCDINRVTSALARGTRIEQSLNSLELTTTITSF